MYTIYPHYMAHHRESSSGRDESVANSVTAIQSTPGKIISMALFLSFPIFQRDIFMCALVHLKMTPLKKKNIFTRKEKKKKKKKKGKQRNQVDC